MKVASFTIKGKPWTLHTHGTRGYVTKHGKDSCAITFIHKREIHLSPTGRELVDIVHELVHAYVGETCTASANLSADAMEEVCADIFSHHGEEILTLAKLLHGKVKK
jgi:hypothetical protein